MKPKRHIIDLIILKKAVFQESSLIVNAFSQKWGRVDFILKNGLSINNKKFPVIDLFREVRVSLKYDDGRFQKIYSAELLNSYENIINFQQNLQDAFEISKFLLKNIQPLIEYQDLYIVIKVSLKRWSENKNEDIPILSIIKFTYLYESGLLPDVEQSQIIWFNNLLNYAKGIEEFPYISKQYWNKFADWINAIQ